MKALVLKGKDCYPIMAEIPTPECTSGQVLVRVAASALNHRDIWIIKGRYPGIQYPLVPGSDGTGLVGEREVVIQPGLNWGENSKAQGKSYQILGLPLNGTFAEYVAVNESQIFDKPPHLSLEQAAALPLAGLTAFRVLFTRCNAVAGEKVLITGIGGGVALFCCQFSLAAGLEVYVTSGSESKLERAMRMGVKGGAIYNRENWHKQLEQATGGFDIIIDSAGGEGFAELVRLCKPGGRIGIYGGTKGAVNLNPQLIFWRQISILGSTMGTTEDFNKMLKFVEHHKIVPVIDSIYKMADAHLAFEKMEAGNQFGKLIIDVTKKM